MHLKLHLDVHSSHIQTGLEAQIESLLAICMLCLSARILCYFPADKYTLAAIQAVKKIATNGTNGERSHHGSAILPPTNSPNKLLFLGLGSRSEGRLSSRYRGSYVNYGPSAATPGTRERRKRTLCCNPTLPQLEFDTLLPASNSGFVPPLMSAQMDLLARTGHSHNIWRAGI